MRRLRLDLEHAICLALVVGVACTVSVSMSDNSLLLHLRTAVNMIDTWSIPRHDPYSFTAHGEPWVVQSWLALAIYGLAHKAGGWHLVIFVHMALAACIAGSIVSVARAGTLVRTLVAAGIPVLLAAVCWSQRPLLFGMLGFALVVFVVVKQRSPLWLLPVMWVWVNTHGSWPIALAWVASMIVGTFIDERKFDKVLLRYLAFIAGGVLLGGINPLGPRLLWFPATPFGDRSSNFAGVIEWSAPRFHSLTGLGLIALIIAALGICFAVKVQWRYGLGALGLFAASLYSFRNMSMFAIAIAPMSHVALVDRKAPMSKTECCRESMIGMCAALVVVLVAVGATVRMVREPSFDFSAYPVTAIDYLQSHKLTWPEHRMATQDYVGCYLIWRYGTQSRNFIDDRVDMYPALFMKNVQGMGKGVVDPELVLKRDDVDVVLWQANTPVANNLHKDPMWRTEWSDGKWVIFTR